MGSPTLTIWMLAGLLAAGGVLLLVAAALPRRSLRGPISEPAAPGDQCACCGYCLAGLETDRCPECGMLMAMAVQRGIRRGRYLRAMGGAMLLGLSALAIPAATAAQYGLAHVLPNIALIEALHWRPSAHPMLEPDLRIRAEGGMLRDWERRRLASTCAGILGVETDQTTRRSAAGLLARVAREAAPEMIVRMLGDRDLSVRVEGALAAARMGPDRVDEQIRSSLCSMAGADRCPTARKRAVDAVRTIGDGRAAKVLARAMQDPNGGVRERALFALWCGPYATEITQAAAASATGDEDEQIRWAAVWVLEQLAQRGRDIPS